MVTHMAENEKQALIQEMKEQISVLKKIQDIAAKREDFDKVIEISRQIQSLAGKIQSIELDTPFL